MPTPSLTALPWLDTILQRHYQCVPSGEEMPPDAQLVNGHWVMPLDGCDTLQAVINDIEWLEYRF